MPVKKKSTRQHEAHEMIDAKTEDLMTVPATQTMKEKNKHWFVGGLVLLALAGAAYMFRTGRIVVATVNGSPIFRWDYVRMLDVRFGAQTLESMITERLIADEAAKEHVVVSDSDVQVKMDSIVKSLGENVNLDDLLKYQGMTKSDFQQQIKLQLVVEKILGKDIAVTDADIDAYVKDNKALLTATDAAAMREEAKQSLTSQKISEKIQPWLTDLKSNAHITKLGQ